MSQFGHSPQPRLTVGLLMFLLKEVRCGAEQRGQVVRVDLAISLPAGALARHHEPCVLRTQGRRERLDRGLLPRGVTKRLRCPLARAQ